MIGDPVLLHQDHLAKNHLQNAGVRISYAMPVPQCPHA